MEEGRSPEVVPVILDWTEKPTGEIVLYPPAISDVQIEGWMDGRIGPVVQEASNASFDLGKVVAVGVVCPIEQLRRAMVSKVL